MRFKAHYIAQKVDDLGNRLEYWRTVDANDLIEAEVKAKRYRRKDFMSGAVIQDTTYMAMRINELWKKHDIK